ncbi:MAG: AAA family ATPase [Solirubrobacteraceae bacterium]
MRGRTTVLLTGRGLGLIEQALAIARELAPATVVFEDIDLVAAECTLPVGHHDILFELLNQMEGLGEDADLLFILTTNRLRGDRRAPRRSTPNAGCRSPRCSPRRAPWPRPTT